MRQGHGNLVGVKSAFSEAGCKWPGLDAVQRRLQSDKYSILEEEGLLIAQRVSSMWQYGRICFFIFRSFSSINRGELILYLDECKKYAELKERWHEYSGYILSAVAICEKVSEDAIRYAVDYHPSKEPSTAAVPIIVDSGRNHVHYFQKVPKFWGVYVYTKMQQEIKDYLCEKGSIVEAGTLQAPTNVCPQCGSSNINKAIKRMPKSRQEMEALGFKAEWECLCFSCRCSWVEKEKR